MKFFFIAFYFFLSAICFSQNKEMVKEISLFSDGIYLKNKKILIPWELNYTDFGKIGDPICRQNLKHKNRVYIRWDSIQIFNGISANLIVHVVKKQLCISTQFPVNVFWLEMDSDNLNKLTDYLYRRIKKRPILIGRNLQRLKIDDIIISIGKMNNDLYLIDVIKR